MKLFSLLFTIFLMNSLMAMEEWDSDAEKSDTELFTTYPGNSSSQRGDITSFYDGTDLRIIYEKLRERSLSLLSSREVDGLIILPKPAKDLQNITCLIMFNEANKTMKTSNWHTNDKINGIIVYFQRPQEYEKASKLFSRIWGVGKIYRLEAMDELYKERSPTSTISKGIS